MKKLFLCVTWAFSGSDTSPSCHSASRTGLQSNKCENYGTENHNSRRVCRKEPLKGECGSEDLQRAREWGQLLFAGNELYFSSFLFRISL